MSGSQSAPLYEAGEFAQLQGADGQRVIPMPPDTGTISGNIRVLTASLVSNQSQSNEHQRAICGHLQEISGHLKCLSDASTQRNLAMGLQAGSTLPPKQTSIIDEESIGQLAHCLDELLRPKFEDMSKRVDDLRSRVTENQQALTKRVDDLNTSVAINQQEATRHFAEVGARVSANQQDIANTRAQVFGDEGQLVELHRRIQGVSEQVAYLRSQQSGDEAVGEIVSAVTQDEMRELTAAIDQLKSQVGDLLASAVPPSRAGQHSTETHPPSAPSRGGRR